MTIPSSHYFIGSALYQLLSAGKDIEIESFPTISKNSFSINKQVGLYTKYTTKNTSPWTFTFKKVHQEEIKVMRELYDYVFIVFVCGKDGIACLKYEDLKHLLDDNFEEAEWIRFSRIGSQRYKVTGKDGELPYKLTIKSFPDDVVSLVKELTT